MCVNHRWRIFFCKATRGLTYFYKNSLPHKTTSTVLEPSFRTGYWSPSRFWPNVQVPFPSPRVTIFSKHASRTPTRNEFHCGSRAPACQPRPCRAPRWILQPSQKQMSQLQNLLNLLDLLDLLCHLNFLFSNRDGSTIRNRRNSFIQKEKTFSNRYKNRVSGYAFGGFDGSPTTSRE
jgi:hypothetical protein